MENHIIVLLSPGPFNSHPIKRHPPFTQLTLRSRDLSPCQNFTGTILISSTFCFVFAHGSFHSLLWREGRGRYFYFIIQRICFKTMKYLMLITPIKRKNVTGIFFKDVPENFVIATVDVHCQLSRLKWFILWNVCGKNLNPRLLLASALDSTPGTSFIVKLVYSQSMWTTLNGCLRKHKSMPKSMP